MARIGIFCPPVPGHMNPMKVVAREMMARGHRVMFFGFADMRSRLPEDLAFVPFGEEERPVGSLQPFLDRLSRLDGIPSMRELIHDYADIAGVIFRHLPAALERDRPDAMIIDQLEYAPASSPARCVCRSPMSPTRCRSTPSLPFPRRCSRGTTIQARTACSAISPLTGDCNSSAIRSSASFSKTRSGSASKASAASTRPGRTAANCRNAFRGSISRAGICRACFIMSARCASPSRRSISPCPTTVARWCSLGTLQGSRAEIFHSVCCAANDLDVNLLIAHGGLLTAEQAAALPGQPMVHAFVPQRAVLARCALAVTHAGFNTVMDSLGCGTPMVAMPITFEQPGIAARLQRAGAAEVLHQDRSVADVTVAMQKVLTRGLYRANARRLGAEIAQAGGVKRAGDLLEQALGLGPKAAA